MAFKLKLINLIRWFAGALNLSITSILIIGFWIFLFRPEIYKDPSWLIWLPAAFVILIGSPLYATFTIFGNGSRTARIIFLALNMLALLFLLTASFAHHWMMAPTDMPFSWYSISKLCLLLGAPFLVNVIALLLIIFREKIISAHRYSSHQNH